MPRLRIREKLRDGDYCKLLPRLNHPDFFLTGLAFVKQCCLLDLFGKYAYKPREWDDYLHSYITEEVMNKINSELNSVSLVTWMKENLPGFKDQIMRIVRCGDGYRVVASRDIKAGEFGCFYNGLVMFLPEDYILGKIPSDRAVATNLYVYANPSKKTKHLRNRHTTMTYNDLQ